MNTKEEIKNYYLKEFSLFDGEFNISFNILDINVEKMIITVAVTKAGKIFVTEYDLKLDKENNLYFQYGVEYTKDSTYDINLMPGLQRYTSLAMIQKISI